MKALRCRGIVHLPGIVLGIVLCLLSSSGYAKPWGNRFDVLFDQPGADVVTMRNKDGSETRRVELPGNVVVEQTRQGDQVSTIAMDRSGHGAILCSWRILVEVKLELDACPSSSTGEVRNRLSYQLERFNKFIRENSYSLMKQEDLDGYVEKRKTVIERKISDAKRREGGGQCLSKFVAQLVTNMEAQSRAAFEAELDQALSVPRFPVAAPCL